MVFLKRKRAGPLVLGLAGLVLSLGTGSASAVAASTWTVTPGGAVTAKAGTTTFKDTKTGTVFTCTTSQENATYKSGSGLLGKDIATISSAAFTTCTGPLGLSFSVAPERLPWFRSAVSYSATTGATKATVTGVFLSLSASGCSATVGGKTATTPAQYTITYTNNTGKLKISSGGTLHIWNVSGCFGLISNGDSVTFSTTYTISPRLTITSP